MRERAPPDVPRLITYNVHRCLGLDGSLSPERIADVIAPFEPDVVALQELDVFRARTGGVDQAHAIANALGMQMHFHPALRVMEELYGDAILTPRPSRLVKAGALPGLAGRPGLEPRGALWAAIQIGGVDVQMINTHLGLRRRERLAQVNALMGPEWIGPSDLPRSGNRHRRLQRGSGIGRLPAVGGGAHGRPTGTAGAATTGDLPGWAAVPAHRPRVREPLHRDPPGRTIRTPVTRRASDHLPLLVDFRIAPTADRRAAVKPFRASVPRRSGAFVHPMLATGSFA